jgi:hypothetical protein
MTAGDGRNPFAVDQDRALAALTFAWGDSYEIYIIDGQWQAWHDDDADQDMLTGTTPDELNRKIRADWSRRRPRKGQTAVSNPVPVLIKTGPADPRAWVRIARAILSDIQAGKLQPGDSRPASAAIAADSGVSTAPVSRALRELTWAGILSRNRGHGPPFLETKTAILEGRPAGYDRPAQ